MLRREEFRRGRSAAANRSSGSGRGVLGRRRVHPQFRQRTSSAATTHPAGLSLAQTRMTVSGLRLMADWQMASSSGSFWTT